MAFFTNAFEVPLSILIEHTQRKVRPVLEVVYVVDDIPFSISTFLPALLTFEMIEPQHLGLKPPPLRPGVEGIHVILGYQPWYLCNAVHPPHSPPQPVIVQSSVINHNDGSLNSVISTSFVAPELTVTIPILLHRIVVPFGTWNDPSPDTNFCPSPV